MRRREPAVERRVGGEPPPWIRGLVPALVEFHRRGGKTKPGEVIPEGFMRWRKAQRDAWCRENGCHRVGKTCEQMSPTGKDCGAGRRAPTGEPG